MIMNHFDWKLRILVLFSHINFIHWLLIVVRINANEVGLQYQMIFVQGVFVHKELLSILNNHKFTNHEIFIILTLWRVRSKYNGNMLVCEKEYLIHIIIEYNAILT